MYPLNTSYLFQTIYFKFISHLVDIKAKYSIALSEVSSVIVTPVLYKEAMRPIVVPLPVCIIQGCSSSTKSTETAVAITV